MRAYVDNKQFFAPSVGNYVEFNFQSLHLRTDLHVHMQWGHINNLPSQLDGEVLTNSGVIKYTRVTITSAINHL